jgi:hypothetical protein
MCCGRGWSRRNYLNLDSVAPLMPVLSGSYPAGILQEVGCCLMHPSTSSVAAHLHLRACLPVVQDLVGAFGVSFNLADGYVSLGIRTIVVRSKFDPVCVAQQSQRLSPATVSNRSDCFNHGVPCMMPACLCPPLSFPLPL